MRLRTWLFLALLPATILTSGCAFRRYLGLHGPTIQSVPDPHSGVSTDAQCLSCHHPQNPVGTPTTHPRFKGCLKCHNDEPKGQS